jgi:anti-anti-sigma factor
MTSVYFTSSVVGKVLLGRIEQEKVAEREAAVIQAEFSAAAPSTSWRAAIDLAPVAMLTSTGLGAIITISKACKANKGKLVVFGLRSEILQVLKITRMDKLIMIATTKDEALKAAGE